MRRLFVGSLEIRRVAATDRGDPCGRPKRVSPSEGAGMSKRAGTRPRPYKRKCHKFLKTPFLLVLCWLTAVCLVACQKDEPAQPPPQLVEELAVSQTAVAELVAGAQGNEAALVVAQATAESAVAALEDVQATAVTAQSEVEIQANRAFAHQIAALSLTKLDTDLPTAVLLAVQASKMADTPTTRSALLYALQHNPRLQRILPADNWPTDVDFSPDGRFLVTAVPGGEVTLYDLDNEEQDGEKLLGLPEIYVSEGGPFPKIAFSPDSRLVAVTNPGDSFSSDTEIEMAIWDVRTRQIVVTSTLRFADLTFLQNNLLVTDDNDDIALWEINEGQLSEISRLSMPEDYWAAGIVRIAAHPKGNTVALGDRDGAIQLWHPFSNQLEDLPGFERSDPLLNLAYNPDGTILAISQYDQTVLWDLTQNVPFGKPIPAVGVLEFSQNGETLLTADNSETIRLWDVATQEVIGKPLQRWGDTRLLLDAALHPDGNIVASSYQDRLTIVWDTAASTRLGRVLHQFPREGLQSSYANSAFVNPSTWVAANEIGALIFLDVETGEILTMTNGFPDSDLQSVTFNHDYTLAATTVYKDGTNTIAIWNVFKNQQIGQSIPLADLSGNIVFNPDSTLLVTGSGEGTLQFWDISTGTLVGEPILDHDQSIVTIIFSPDGTILASKDANKIHLRDSQTNQLLFVLTTPFSAERLVFNPRNNELVNFEYPFQANVWDTTDGEYIGELTPGRGGPRNLIFSPDGTYRASEDLDYIDFGTRQPLIALWDNEIQWQIGPNLLDYYAPVFNQDGSILAATHLQSDTNPQEIVLWDMGLERWQEVACQLVNQNFSEEAWGLYFGERPYEQTCPLSP